MNALVLGATGLIGGHICRALRASGHAVRAFKRRSSVVSARDGVDGLVFAIGDLMDPASIRAALRGCDVLFHAAGYYPTVSLDRDAALTKAVVTMRNVLAAASEAARGDGALRRIVFTSSLSTIAPPGEGGRLADERDLYVPGSVPDAYYEAKWAMEAEAYRAVARGLPVVIVNPTLCFGPFDPKPTSGRLVRDVALGRVPGFLEGRVNAVDVRDVAVGHVRAAERGNVGERYVLGNENLLFSELVRRIARLAGVEPPRLTIPNGVAVAVAYASEILARYVTGRPPWLPLEGVRMIQFGQHLDCSKARRELELPQSPVDGAIRDALAWFRSRGKARAGGEGR